VTEKMLVGELKWESADYQLKSQERKLGFLGIIPLKFAILLGAPWLTRMVPRIQESSIGFDDLKPKPPTLEVAISPRRTRRSRMRKKLH